MKRWKRGLKRITAIALSAILAGTTVDMTAFTVYAAESMQSELCEHHTEHTEDCGYVEAQEGSDCNHEHGEECYSENTTCVHNHDGECGYAEAVEGSSCNHTCDENCEESCIHTEHTEECGYKEAQEGSPCTHECSEESGCITLKENCSHSHDDTCGYKEAVEGSPCTFVCDVCASEEKGTTTCNCGTDDKSIHATNCPAYETPENPKCYCKVKCTEDNVNVWCDICGFDYTACEGEGTVTAYAVGDTFTVDNLIYKILTEADAESPGTVSVIGYKDNTTGVVTIPVNVTYQDSSAQYMLC